MKPHPHKSLKSQSQEFAPEYPPWIDRVSPSSSSSLGSFRHFSGRATISDGGSSVAPRAPHGTWPFARSRGWTRHSSILYGWWWSTRSALRAPCRSPRAPRGSWPGASWDRKTVLCGGDTETSSIIIYAVCELYERGGTTHWRGERHTTAATRFSRQ